MKDEPNEPPAPKKKRRSKSDVECDECWGIWEITCGRRKKCPVHSNEGAKP